MNTFDLIIKPHGSVNCWTHGNKYFVNNSWMKTRHLWNLKAVNIFSIEPSLSRKNASDKCCVDLLSYQQKENISVSMTTNICEDLTTIGIETVLT